jgi:[lysine-biosynthesis-protein LysW]--L-2-aminoadipate ligase
VGVLCSRVRLEEKQIFRALREREVPFERIDVREITLALSGGGTEHRSHVSECAIFSARYDVVLIRCLSHTRALYAARMLESQGVRTVNAHRAIAICGDKVLTTMALVQHGVPIPGTAIAFSQDAALAAMERMGYPVVVKPAVGSWGRLMAKLNDREAAEAVLEHKKALEQADPYYIQAYVDKPGRDIRTLVVGDETVYAVYRHSLHWITNTARGGETAPCPMTPEIDHISRAAARAVGGEVVAVDLLEAQDGSLLVNEVNHTPEFHGAVKATDADAAGRIVAYALRVAADTREQQVESRERQGKMRERERPRLHAAVRLSGETSASRDGRGEKTT